MAAGDPGVLQRNYSAIAVETTLTASISASSQGASGTIIVGSVAGYPSATPYTLVLEPDTSREEVITVTAATSGTTLTVLRGQDNTQALAHSAGVSVRHAVSGRDFKETKTHEAARGYDSDQAIMDLANQTHVHGIVTGEGVVVGTLKAQSLSNKTLVSPIITGTPGIATSIVFEGSTADDYETTLTVTDPTADRTITLPNATGTVVLDTFAQTLSNKTLTSPIISGSPVITGLSSAGMSASSATPKDYVDAILGSATAAASSATAAASSAMAAATSASNASASATSATASASSATASASSATASASSATNSASAASTSASNASASATSATASASAAATSATAASSSATAAASSATAAASSATASASSATAASNSATSAAASATAAASSATDAATTYDNFDDRYLGSKSTAPTVDNDGNTLLVGAIYWNSTLNAMYVWSGSVWVQIATTSIYSAPTLGSQVIASGTTYTNIAGLTINSTTIPSSATLTKTSDKLSVFAATTSAELRGVISDETGTDALVFANTPTLVTPVLGVATATSINGTTIPSSKTLVATDSTQYVVPSQSGQNGKYLTTDGTTSSWAAITTDPTPTVLMLGGM